jgi:hypothetical protein
MCKRCQVKEAAGVDSWWYRPEHRIVSLRIETIDPVLPRQFSDLIVRDSLVQPLTKGVLQQFGHRGKIFLPWVRKRL